MGWGAALAVGASLLGGMGSTPRAQRSEAEQAQAELMSAMREGWKERGIPLQRERIAQTLGIRYNTETKSYDRDPNMRRANFDGDGNMRFNATASGESVAGVSQAYESQRGAFNPNTSVRGDSMGDIDQAKDEAGAANQATQMDTVNAYRSLGNAAGIAHGAQMQAAESQGQLAAQQATQANFNAASRFAKHTNNRGLAGEAIGAGLAMRDRFQPQTPTQRLGNRRLHSGGR